MNGPPDDADRTHRERSAAEVDAEFAAIVNGFGATGPDTRRTDGTHHDPAANSVIESERETDTEEVGERERRRAQRRAQRAEEVASFEADNLQAQADLQADDAHFVPPEPPPLPTPKRRTVVAVLFMVLGLVVMIRPSLLEVAPDVVLVLGIGCLIGGFAMLIHGLRPRAADPDDADGWDDGARL